MTTKQMFAFIFLFAALCWLPVFATAEPLSMTDMFVETGVIAALNVDRIESDRIAAHSMREANPLLGAAPSHAKVRNYFVGMALIHISIAYFLPPEYRLPFQTATLGVEAGVISINLANGLGR